jgi:hypothetical protein
MNFTDHGIARDISQFGSNLACGQARLPELLELLNAIVGPTYYRHRTHPFVARHIGGAAWRLQIEKPCPQNPLAAARRTEAAGVDAKSSKLRKANCRTRCRI